VNTYSTQVLHIQLWYMQLLCIWHRPNNKAVNSCCLWNVANKGTTGHLHNVCQMPIMVRKLLVNQVGLPVLYDFSRYVFNSLSYIGGCNACCSTNTVPFPCHVGAWRWLWNAAHCIRKEDRKTLMQGFHSILYATSDITVSGATAVSRKVL